MNVTYNPEEIKRIGETRQSFSAILLNDRQFDDVIAITGIMERTIKETGRFQKKLDDYSSAFAASENFNIAKANTIIRDIYKARTGESMKQTLDKLLNKEKALFDRENNPAEAERDQAYRAANEIGQMVEQGNKMTFNRAFAYEASQLATNLGTTDAGAKKLISETFKETENRDFKEWGMELDKTYYRPQIEAEKQDRALAKQSHGQAYSR